MSFTDKKTLSVADAVKKIMEASAKKADKDYDKDGKIESPKDEVWGSRLRAAKMAGKLKEEEQIDELSKDTLGSYVKKATQDARDSHTDYKNSRGSPDAGDKHLATLALGKFYNRSKNIDKAKTRLAKEETEQIDEAFPTVADGEKSLKAKEGKTAHGKITKTKTGMKHERDYDDQPEPEVKRGRGRPKKKLSEMRKEYLNYFGEEVDNETFTKEIKDQEAKFAGKKKGADVAKASVQAVKQEEVEQIDEKEGYGESDPLQNRADYAAAKKPGQVYKKTHASDKKGMTKSYAYDISRTGPKGKLPEEVEQIDEVSPPGREKQVKALKKVPGIDNPWAVAWASYRKSHPKKSKE